MTRRLFEFAQTGKSKGQLELGVRFRKRLVHVRDQFDRLQVLFDTRMNSQVRAVGTSGVDQRLHLQQSVPMLLGDFDGPFVRLCIIAMRLL